MNRQIGTVIKRVKGFYYVDVRGDTNLCRIKGNLFKGKKRDNAVSVGDRVEIDLDAAEDAGWIYKILPRTSMLSRPSKEGREEQVLVSNVEHLLIVCSVKNPHFRAGIVDRFLITAQRGGLHPIIILNKVDLSTKQEIQVIQNLYESLGYHVLLTSVPQNIGLEEFRSLLQNHTSVLSGHSGVGKSSLLKALFPGWEIRVGQISESSKKGKHTTTISEMYRLPDGGFVVDTPGIRELGLYQMNPEDLDQYFIEFEKREFQCKFKGCSHRHEPSCGVQYAVEEKKISLSRYQSYCAIYKSLLEDQRENSAY